MKRAMGSATGWTLALVLAVVGATVTGAAKSSRPNILFFMGDDLGYNDVSYHGSNQIPTPNIDALCHSGVNLNRYYVTPMCTPTRMSLLSGKYAFTSGQGELVLFAAETRGYDLNVTLLPQYLKKYDYVSHLVGKWHMGNYKREYTPTFRGFDSHLGCWTGHIDYYNHTALERNPDPTANQSILWLGHDFRRNLDVAWDLQGQYATDIFTARALEIIQKHDQTKPLYLQMSHTAPHAGNIWDPVQAPKATVAKFTSIEDEKRRTYAGMVTELDNSLGIILEAMNKAGMLDNSIIVFSTDNGGTNNPLEGDEGSNWPLRGMKNTMWEGGVRGAGCLWSSMLKRGGIIYNELMQVTDWLPTLYKAIGGDVADLGKLDGINQWDAINNGGKSPRTELFVHADRIQNMSAIIDCDWKLVQGGSFQNAIDAWYGVSGRDKDYKLYSTDAILNSKAAKALSGHGNVVKSAEEIKMKRSLVSVKCEPPPSNTTAACRPCLYNLKVDPCERMNVAGMFPAKVTELTNKLKYQFSIAKPPQNTAWDLAAYPGNWNNTWTDFADSKPN